MSLNCPTCGTTLSLNLAVAAQVEPQIEAQAGEVEPQVVPQSRVGGVRTSGRARYQYNDQDFQTFWATYPRRVGKASAFSRWKQVIREVEPQIVIEAAAQYAAQVAGVEPQFIKYPEGWLSAGRWDDEAPPEPSEPDPATYVGSPEWNAARAEEDARYGFDPERLDALVNGIGVSE